MSSVPVEHDQSQQEAWDCEWRDAILKQCLNEIRNEVKSPTFEAFTLFACEGWPAEQVAARLNITTNAVFGAKRRVLARIREKFEQREITW